jgi:hypothetical protein
MSKRRLGRAMLRCYPKNVRDCRGEEILGTVLDAGDASSVAFVRELVSMVTGGFTARSREALSTPPATLVTHAIVWVSVIAIATFPSLQGNLLLRYDFSVLPTKLALLEVGLPLGVLALFTFGSRRAAGLLGLAWVALHVRSSSYMTTVAVVEFVMLTTPGFCLLTLRPRSTPTAMRYLWLAFAVIWVVPQLAGFENFRDVAHFFPVVAVVFVALSPEFALGLVAYWAVVALSASSGVLPAHGSGIPGSLPGGGAMETALLFGWTALVLVLVAIGRRRAAKHSYG